MAIPTEELLQEDFDFPINEANLDQFRQVQNILPLLGPQRGVYGGGAIGSGGFNLTDYTPQYSSMVSPIATGQAYAQQIAGGIPFEQVVAPGMSFSPEQPGGYTQADLNVVNLPRDVAPVFPEAPTKGEAYQPSEPTMPYAPTGTPMPEALPSFFGQIPKFDPSQLDIFDFLGLSAPPSDGKLYAGGSPGLYRPGGKFGPPQKLPSPEQVITPPSDSKLEDFQIYKPPFELPTQEAQDFVALPEGYSFTRPEGIMYSTVMPRDGMRYAYGPNGERIEVTDYRKDFADFSITDESPAFTFQDGGFVPVSQPIIQPIEDIRSTFTPEIIAEQSKEQQEKEEREMQNIERKFGNIENLQERISNIMSSAPIPAPTPSSVPVMPPTIPMPTVAPTIPNLFVDTPAPRPTFAIDDIVKPIRAGSSRFSLM